VYVMRTQSSFTIAFIFGFPFLALRPGNSGC
jgi:hypothetical protein